MTNQAIKYLEYHPELKANLLATLGNMDAAHAYVEAHLTTADYFFKHHPDAEAFHSTANGQVFHKANDAHNHAARLNDKRVLLITRAHVTPIETPPENEQPVKKERKTKETPPVEPLETDVVETPANSPVKKGRKGKGQTE